MKTNPHDHCPHCGHMPPTFVQEVQRQPLGENGKPEWMALMITVRVYKCPNCEKMWNATVKPESEM